MQCFRGEYEYEAPGEAPHEQRFGGANGPAEESRQNELRGECGQCGEREESCECFCEGRRNRKIAEGLSISEGTVKVHLHNIYEKLGLEGRMELVLYARQRGLVEEP